MFKLSIEEQKVEIYLKLICEATKMLSENSGSSLADVWGFINETHGVEEGTVDYADFCRSVDLLVDQGRLILEQDLLSVEFCTYHEIWDEKRREMENLAQQEQADQQPTSLVQELERRSGGDLIKEQYLFRIAEAQRDLLGSIKPGDRLQKSEVWRFLRDAGQEGGSQLD